MMPEIKNEIILEEIRRTKEDLKSVIEALEVKILLKIEETNRRINKLKKQNIKLEENIEKLERRSKQNNIVVFGLNQVQQLSVKDICCELEQLLDVNVNSSHVNNFFPLGKAESCPIKVEFTSFLTKAEIFKNVKKLKGKSVTISHDLTENQRRDQKILRKYLYLAKQNNHKICYIKRNKLYVDGQIYSAQDLESFDEPPESLELKSSSASGTPMCQTYEHKSTNKETEVRSSKDIRNTPTTSSANLDKATDKKEVKEVSKLIKEKKITRSSNK